MVMDVKAAVLNYQFAERAKSELILSSHLINALSGFSPEERPGAKKMLILFLEGIRSETGFAAKSTGEREFQKAFDTLSLAISGVEGNDAENAVLKIGETVSSVTTVAQKAWQVLSENNLI